MTLGEVLKTNFKEDQQGQLVIKFAGEQHLCKISVEKGQAVYLALGHMNPDEALDAVVGKAVEWSNFIKGMPVRKRLDEPITQLLLNIAEAAPPAEADIQLDAITAAVKAAMAEVVVKTAPAVAIVEAAPDEVIVNDEVKQQRLSVMDRRLRGMMKSRWQR